MNPRQAAWAGDGSPAALTAQAQCAGAKFVKSTVRTGVLPGILAALMNARNATRASLKALEAGDVGTRAVLDSRQKALKLVAKALYGFTGRYRTRLGI